MKEAIKMMHRMQRERHVEKRDTKLRLDEARSTLPPCILVMTSLKEAQTVAASLNTDLSVASASGKDSEKNTIPKAVTPAAGVRRQLAKGGWYSLSTEEQQFIIMDIEVNRHSGKYDWLFEDEEAKNRERIAKGKKPMPYPPSVSAAVQPFQMSKIETEYILQQPFNLLNRHEMRIRKLFTKFHDDISEIEREMQSLGYGFDAHLAERTRAKASFLHSSEEQSWASMDRVLHAEVRRRLTRCHRFRYSITLFAISFLTSFLSCQPSNYISSVSSLLHA